MSSVQTLATWSQIAAKIDTFPKLPAGSVDIFLTKSEILAKGGGLVKIEDGYSDNSFVALEHVSQYVVEWRYTFDVSPTSVSLPYQGTGKGVTISSYKRKFINNIDQNEQVSVDYSVASKPDWCTVSGTTISASQNGENARSGSVTWTQAESGKQASCSVSQAAGVVSWRYVLEITAGATLNFAGNTSGSKEVHFNSRKYKQVNGVDTGESAWVPVEAGFSSGEEYNSFNRDRLGEGILTVSVGANGSLSSRSEVDYIRQAESGKEVYFTCNQTAGQEGWNYYFSASPSSLSFVATGGSQNVSISSYRRRTINGSEDGHQENVNYSVQNSGGASVSGATVSIGENTSTSGRSGTVTWIQSASGKTISVDWSQAGATVTYEYYIYTDQDNYIDKGAQLFEPYVESYKEIYYNGDYSSNQDLDWQIVNYKGPGSVSGRHAISVPANNTPDERDMDYDVKQDESGKTCVGYCCQEGLDTCYLYTGDASSGSATLHSDKPVASDVSVGYEVTSMTSGDVWYGYVELKKGTTGPVENSEGHNVDIVYDNYAVPEYDDTYYYSVV